MFVPKDGCAFRQAEKICGLVFLKLQEDTCFQFVLLVNAASASGILIMNWIFHKEANLGRVSRLFIIK